MERLILFDIDGTLTRTENGYVPFNEAILQTFGCNGDIRTVVPDGNTDPLIIQDIFAKADFVFEFEDRIWQQFTINLRERYHHHVLQGTTRIRALAGADALLRALAASEKICPSVVTGNFEATPKSSLKPPVWRPIFAAAHMPAIRRCALICQRSRKRDASKSQEARYCPSIASSSATRRMIYKPRGTMT